MAEGTLAAVRDARRAAALDHAHLPEGLAARVPDGRAFEAHRRAFGERWRRNFGEPVGFWTKEFQLAEGRPHLHLLMKGPDSMPDADYRGFQERTRQAKDNERVFGKYQGGQKRNRSKRIRRPDGHDRAEWWAEIVTGNTDRRHYGPRGGRADRVLQPRRRRGAVKATRRHRRLHGGRDGKGQAEGPARRVRNRRGLLRHLGPGQGFRPQVNGIEVDQAVWDQINRRLTRLMGWRRAVRRGKGHQVGDGWKRRRNWQGITVGGLGPDELARLMAWSVAAAERQGNRPGPLPTFSRGLDRPWSS